MPVLSRPSLRSSARRGADPESPATDDGREPSRTQPGKRTRDSSIGSTSSNKKLRIYSHSNTRNSSTEPKRQALKSLPFRDRQPVTKKEVTQVVKSRSVDPVLVPPRNYGTTPLNAAFDGNVHNGINQNVSVSEMEKRSLRSHGGGSRSRSELEPYFSNYEELVSIEPKDPGSSSIPSTSATLTPSDILTPETILNIYDEPLKPASFSSSHLDQHNAGKQKLSGRYVSNGTVETSSVAEWPEETFTTLNNATRIDLSNHEQRGRKATKDPLDDSLYIRVHAREERKEKHLRNIEKERAMHEKIQLERLLDGLRGHDWLRVMGISGITDTEKKLYEPKRDHLIHEVRTLLEKFRLWKEEEKRRKAEKDGMLEYDEDEEEDLEDETDTSENDEAISEGDPPDYSNVDASAARQLHMEAMIASRPKMHPNSTGGTSKNPPPKTQPAEKPFTSFYAKPYMRAAAIGKHRRSGRSRTAFGQPIPDVPEKDFELPQEVMTTEAKRESDRRRRKRNRDSEDG